MADHDSSYKLIFSHASMTRDLIRGFVHEEWVQQLDLSTLERVGGGFVADDLRDRECDIVWRARWGEGDWVYIYLLLEFQATVDDYMALRLMTYTGLLYQDLLRQGSLPPSGKLPPVFPLVLYNGYRPWRAARDVADLVEPMPVGLEPYRPGLRYCLLDEQRLAESDLGTQRNLAAAMFRLERSRNLESFREALWALIDWLREPEQESLERAFTTWIKRVLLPARELGVPIPEVMKLQEIRTMLTKEEEELGISWSRNLRAEGKAEGIAAGRAEGMKRIVLDQLSERFGPLSTEARHRVDEMSSPDDLADLGRRLLKARSLADLGLEH